MAKLVAMLRVKDGILFVAQWLARTSELADEIVVVDNGSTDGTYELLRAHPQVTALERTAGFDEGRDKILAHSLARSRQADWILWLDVDEIFEDRMTRHILDAMMSVRGARKYGFRLFNFHGDYRHFEARVDKLWDAACPALRMWRDHPGAYFRNLKIHNGFVAGVEGRTRISPMRIKHIGAVDKEYLRRKTDIYLGVDPARADMYQRHRDQTLPVWSWYEFAERPVLVTAQNALFDAMNGWQRATALGRAVCRLMARLRRRRK